MWLRANRVNLHTDYQKLPIKFKKIDGLEIAYREYGNPDGVNVIAIPPWPFAGCVYTPLALALEDHVHMIQLDLPGLGGASADFNKKATVANYKDFTEKFISSFEFDEFSLIGLSMGGVIAHLIATDRKLKPKKLALISTLFNGMELSEDSQWFMRANNILRNKMKIPAPLLKLLVGEYILSWGRKGQYYDRYKDSFALKSSVKETLNFDIDDVLDMLVSLVGGTEIKGWLPEDIETLIMYADGDEPAFKKESIAMAEHLDIEPVVLDNTDHHHLFYDVNKSSDVILNFLVA